ncbi:MAG TPA: hypothetical protein VGE07_09395 [Herpetosiphonaceae bacterium]
MDVLDPLRDAGLTVEMWPWDPEEIAMLMRRLQERRAAGKPSDAPYLYWAFITHPGEPPETRVSRLRVQLEDRQSCIWRLWETIPGPRVYEFHCWYPSIAAAVPAIIAFSCGTPTVIAEWLVPFHRHPELRPAIAQARILRARRTTSVALAHHQAAHRRKEQVDWERGIARWGLQEALRRQYVVCDHATDPTRKLYLRRDSQAAWIVES